MQITNEVKNGFKETEIGLIPEDWELVKLKDIAKIRLGRTPERKKKEYWENGKIPWVKVGDLDSAIIYDTSEKISEVAFKEKFYSKFIPKGTLLFSFKLTIGKVGILGMDAVHNEAIASLFVDEDKVDKHFLFFLLPLLNFKTLLDRYVKGNTLNREKLKILPIPLPPLLEQQKIAFVLSKIQQAIEHQDKIIEATKNLKKSLMHKLFTEGIGHTKFKNSEIGQVPESWKIIKLGKVAAFQYGYTTSAIEESIGPKLLRITDIKEGGRISWDEVPHCKINSSVYEKYKLVDGDILVARIGATTGKTCIIRSAPNAIFGSYLIRVSVDGKQCLPEYVYYFTNTLGYWSQINANKEGKLKKGISASLLKTLSVPIPALSEQQKIIRSLATLDNKIGIEEKRKALLEHLFKTMLSKLMTGEIRVKDLDLSDYHVN